MNRAPHVPWLLVCGGVLVWEVASGPHLYDAGELAAAAWSLGGSHPPGQPLHAIIGHAFSLVPLGPIPFRIALLSVAGELLAAWLVGRGTSMLLLRLGAPQTWVTRFAPDAAALAVLLAPPMLRQAMRIEVYGLAMALTMFGMIRLMEWLIFERKAVICLAQVALVTGLLAGVHPPHALSLVLTSVVAFSVITGWKARSRMAAMFMAMAGSIALVVYSYLPLRAISGALVWGEPTTIRGFVDYVSGFAFHSNLKGTKGSYAETIVEVAAYIAHAAGPFALVGVVIVCALAWGAKGKGGNEWTRIIWLLMGVPLAALPACIQPVEEQNPDNVAYVAPAVALLIVIGAVGFVSVIRLRGIWKWASVGIVPLGLHPFALSNAMQVLRADIPAFETMAGLLLDTPPSRAFVVVETDYAAGAWMMARAVEEARPDVALLVSGLSTSSWHWKTFRHPLFNGLPLRGVGKDPWALYTNGAVRRAMGHVAVLTEGSEPLRGQGVVAGPYLMVDPRNTSNHLARCMDCTGERLADWVGSEAFSGPEGDHGAVHAVFRHFEIERARRLFGRSYAKEASFALARTIRWLPSDQRGVISKGEIHPRVSRLLPRVSDPGHFLVSKEEAVRDVVVWLVSAGRTSDAMILLNAQLKRGEPRALLQVAWIHAMSGNIVDARRARDAFVAVAPRLAAEARDLDPLLGLNVL